MIGAKEYVLGTLVHVPTGMEIRGSHPDHFRSGQWARLVGAEWSVDRLCWLVVFPKDEVRDQWPVYDPAQKYEFRYRP